VIVQNLVGRDAEKDPALLIAVDIRAILSGANRTRGIKLVQRHFLQSDMEPVRIAFHQVRNVNFDFVFGGFQQRLLLKRQRLTGKWSRIVPQQRGVRHINSRQAERNAIRQQWLDTLNVS
jgi:hypothetical protein